MADDSLGQFLEWAHGLIKRFPVRAWIIGTLLPVGLAVNHCLVIRATNGGAIAWLTLLVTAASAIAGLLVDMYALRAISSLGIALRPFALVISFVLMICGLLLVRELLY